MEPARPIDTPQGGELALPCDPVAPSALLPSRRLLFTGETTELRVHSPRALTGLELRAGQEVLATARPIRSWRGRRWLLHVPPLPVPQSLALHGLANTPVVAPDALRVVERIQPVLTFDDGPSVERDTHGRTPTSRVLDTLAEGGLPAAFFVLTGPDVFRHWLGPRPRFRKGETAEGFALMVRAAREGHRLEVHWGGEYGSQHVLHPARLPLPPYDINGDGAPEGNNALESDLLQCRGRIQQAYGDAGARRAPTLVRAPLWVYRNAQGDARPVYERLGLHRVGTDAKLGDGGYPGAGYTFLPWLASGLRKSLAAGVWAPVITLHDSNPRTARDLPRVLHAVAQVLSRAGVPRERWRFLGAESLSSVLRRRRAWVSGG